MGDFAKDFLPWNEKHQKRVAEYELQRAQGFCGTWVGTFLALVGLTFCSYLGVWDDYHKFEIPAAQVSVVAFVVGLLLLIWGVARERKAEKILDQ